MAGFHSPSNQLLPLKSWGATLVFSVFSRRFCYFTAEHLGLQSLQSYNVRVGKASSRTQLWSRVLHKESGSGSRHVWNTNTIFAAGNEPSLWSDSLLDLLIAKLVASKCEWLLLMTKRTGYRQISAVTDTVLLCSLYTVHTTDSFPCCA